MIDKSALKRQINEISQLADLPEHLRNIIIENKQMAKKIFILEAELSQKQSIIEQLKEQLDSTVIEQTQLKLSTIRNIEHQVNQKVNEIKHKYYEKDVQMQGEIEGLREVITQLKSTIKQLEQRELSQQRKIDSLKQYMAQALDEKDFLINELGQIINQQQQKINSCSFCSKSTAQLCRQANKNQKVKKKAPYIAKNE